MNFLATSVKPPQTGAALVAIGLSIYAMARPNTGRFADRSRRRRIILPSCVPHVMLAVPVFVLLPTGNALPRLAFVITGSPRLRSTPASH